MIISDILEYDPDSGVISFKLRRGRRKSGDQAGYLTNKGYRLIEINGVVYMAHRLAFLLYKGYLPEDQIDHINNIKDDNRWVNLRECSASENCRNKAVRSDSGTGIKGVAYHTKTNKYHVQMTVNGKQRRFGCYSDLELAELIAREVREKYHGEFSRH